MKSLFTFLIFVLSLGYNFAQVLSIDSNKGMDDIDYLGKSVLSEVFFQIEETSGFQGETVCLDFLASGFNEITGFSFTIAYNNTIVKFKDLKDDLLINKQGLQINNITDFGVVLIQYDGGAQGESLVDGQSIFSLCFEIIGAEGEMTPISMISIPTPILFKDVDSGSMGIPFDVKNGSILVEKGSLMTIQDTIFKEATCVEDGRIEIVMEGGVEPYDFLWEDNSTTNKIKGPAGVYKVQVKDHSSPPQLIEVELELEANHKAPDVFIGDDFDFDCEAISFLISAQVLNDVSDVSYSWSSDVSEFDDTKIKSIQIVEPGTYILLATNKENGCIGSDTIHAIDQRIIPEIKYEADTILLNCQEESFVIKPTIFINQENIKILWSSQNGEILSSENQLEMSGKGYGKYQFSIIVENTGCQNYHNFYVIENENLGQISPIDDIFSCYDSVQVTIDKTDGLNLSFNEEINFEKLTDTEFLFFDLKEGENNIVVNGSTDDCENLVEEEIQIELPKAIVCKNDKQTISSDTTAAEINYIQNDIIQSSDFSFNIINADNFDFEKGEGIVAFTNLPLDSLIKIEYQICDDICPDNCDTAFLIFNRKPKVIEPEKRETNIRANSISPNGDGVNEYLVFEELINSDFPATLQVFGQWGGVVYENKDYKNDWAGTNNSNKDLPEGTYFYFLYIDDGKITTIRGDITIFR